jgi:hypothetical protein
MKKFFVVLVLVLACSVLAEVKSTSILKEVPEEYRGTYYMYGTITRDKSEPKDVMFLGEMQTNTMVHMDGAVRPITEISIEHVGGKKVLIVRFSATKEYFKVARIDENFFVMYLCDEGAEKCAYTLVIKIKKNKEI